MSVQGLIEEARALSPNQIRQLIHTLIDLLPADEPPKQHSILELRGLGAEIWEGIDPQEYVNQLRSEWDHRP